MDKIFVEKLIKEQTNKDSKQRQPMVPINGQSGNNL